MQLQIYGNVIRIRKGSVCVFERENFFFTICHHDPEFRDWFVKHSESIKALISKQQISDGSWTNFTISHQHEPKLEKENN